MQLELLRRWRLQRICRRRSRTCHWLEQRRRYWLHSFCPWLCLFIFKLEPDRMNLNCLVPNAIILTGRWKIGSFRWWLTKAIDLSKSLSMFIDFLLYGYTKFVFLPCQVMFCFCCERMAMFSRAYVLIIVYILAWMLTSIKSMLIMLQSAKYLLQSLDNYESAVGDSNIKTAPHIEAFPPAFQAIPRNPIVLDIAFNFIDFPSLENRMKKDRKGFISRLWGWVPLARFCFHLCSLSLSFLPLFAAQSICLCWWLQEYRDLGTDPLTTSRPPCTNFGSQLENYDCCFSVYLGCNKDMGPNFQDFS